MSPTKERRRLGLLTEILPAPTAPVPGGPRSRALTHLQKLLVMASTAALMDGCDGASGSGYGVVDPMPAPACISPFEATATATIVGDTIELLIETKTGSSLEPGPVTIRNAKTSQPEPALTDKLDGNKRLLTFKIDDGSLWSVSLPGQCGDRTIEFTVLVKITNKTEISTEIPPPMQ